MNKDNFIIFLLGIILTSIGLLYYCNYLSIRISVLAIAKSNNTYNVYEMPSEARRGKP